MRRPGRDGEAEAKAHVKPSPRLSAEQRWVERTLAHMTLREKVGQLFVINGYGQSVQDPNPQMVAFNKQYYGVSTIKQLIQKYQPGGIIYFNWTNNLQSPQQIVGLSNGIQQASKVPMLISTDQEQGEVLRIGPPATVLPGNMALGATQQPGLARQAALITGQELRAMGINVDDAPVVDVNVNPLNEADGIRSFGDRPPNVSAFASDAVRGYQTKQSTAGVAATAKHFPGLGDTTINSDNGKSISEQTLAQIRATNFPPFKAAMKAGLDLVMAGHIVFPNVKPPRGISSLSRFFVGKLLRQELGYKGVVITDALNAGALAGLSPQTIALGAIRAGDDLLLEIGQTGVDNGKADLVTAYPAVLTAVQKGDIGMRRLNESVRRILRLKWRLGLAAHRITPPSRVAKVVGITGAPRVRRLGLEPVDHAPEEQRRPPSAHAEYRQEGSRHGLRPDDHRDARPGSGRARLGRTGDGHRLQPLTHADPVGSGRGAGERPRPRDDVQRLGLAVAGAARECAPAERDSDDRLRGRNAL